VYELVLSAHVVAAIVGFGATFTYPFIERSGDYGTVLLISRRLAVPGALVVGATGLYQLLDGPYGLDDGWLAASVVLYVLVMIVAVGLVAPAYRRAAHAEPDSRERAQARRRLAVPGPALALAIVVIAVLMVTKPA
jgi:uncharacterized membrane protein